jgi:hypothetical protein
LITYHAEQGRRPGPGRARAPARSNGQALAGVRLKSRQAVSKAAGIVIKKSSVLVLLAAAQRQQASARTDPTRGNSTATAAP